jgi:carbon monoxide dehydrogenase subunit G
VRLDDRFNLDAPIERAWTHLRDLERVAPCLPGAVMEAGTADRVEGKVKLKIGAMTVGYKGAVELVEADEETHTIVLRAGGREQAGHGSVTAQITARLEPAGAGTAVTMATELSITGRVAKFGRGIVADVSSRLLADFAQRLEAEILREADGASPASSGPLPPVDVMPASANRAEPRGAPTAASQRPGTGEATPVDVLALARGALLRRLAVAVGAALSAVFVLWLLVRAGGAG